MPVLEDGECRVMSVESEDSPGRRDEERDFCPWMDGDFNLAFEKLCVWSAECVHVCWCVFFLGG